MGQIIKSLAPSVCLSARTLYGRNFCSILMKFCKEVGGRKSKNAFVRGSKSDDLFPLFCPIFTGRQHSLLYKLQSPELATTGLSVRPSVMLALSPKDAS